ncbi:LysE family transporter [Aureimonas sp. AU4]|uniref:LysE family transporter n=1 Tax=Aureimonas sp. AU4 TaxID=1638163 RepID=UPI000784CF7E|nr:LysE family transporter [Aureimonas sp. AU4]
MSRSNGSPSRTGPETPPPTLDLGPDFVVGGDRRSLHFIAGITAGLGSMAALVRLGLGGLLSTLPSLALGMEVLGSAYLLWLAWQTAGRGAPRMDGGTAPNGFVAGAWTVWHNPEG